MTETLPPIEIRPSNFFLLRIDASDIILRLYKTMFLVHEKAIICQY